MSAARWPSAMPCPSTTMARPRAVPSVADCGSCATANTKGSRRGWAPTMDVPPTGPRASTRDAGVAYNVWLASDDLGAARAIAREVRASGGGLPALQALGLPLASRGRVQVSMNLLDHRITPIPAAYDRVAEAAARRGIAVERGELVGLAPRAAFAGRAPASVGLANVTPERLLDTYLARLDR